LIDKYLTKANRSYLYACFVDFKSAFDTVWRNALMYKLCQHGIGGNVLGVIKSMYEEVIYCVKTKVGLTETFKSIVGVKQGCVLSPTLFNIFLSDLPEIFNDSCDPVPLLDVNLNCLMFADDIVLVSETASGLQNSIELLALYCQKWNLTININKTKVIIFNKGGHTIKQFRFSLNAQEIEIVQSYCYLGIIFSSSGNFTKAVANLSDKALKALHCMKQLDIRNNIKLAFKLFNTLVVPILKYGCEAWAPFYLKNLNSTNLAELCNAPPIEKINIKFCKYLLGVHRKTANFAVLGELGKYPLLLDAFSHSINNWVRICHLPAESIIKKSYVDSLLSSSKQSHSWCSIIYTTLSHLHISDHWETQAHLWNTCATLSLKNKLETTYSNIWLNKINHHLPKLRTYKLFKKEFCFENYLHFLKLKDRKHLSKLRTSSHCLTIETGRYTRPATPPEQRLCNLCDQSAIEDEEHFLLHCKFYNTLHEELFNSLKTISTLTLEPNTDTFCTLMNSLNDYEISNVLADFVNKAFKKRFDLLQSLSTAPRTS